MTDTLSETLPVPDASSDIGEAQVASLGSIADEDREEQERLIFPSIPPGPYAVGSKTLTEAAPEDILGEQLLGLA